MDTAQAAVYHLFPAVFQQIHPVSIFPH